MRTRHVLRVLRIPFVALLRQFERHSKLTIPHTPRFLKPVGNPLPLASPSSSHVAQDRKGNQNPTEDCWDASRRDGDCAFCLLTPSALPSSNAADDTLANFLGTTMETVRNRVDQGGLPWAAWVDRSPVKHDSCTLLLRGLDYYKKDFCFNGARRTKINKKTRSSKEP